MTQLELDFMNTIMHEMKKQTEQLKRIADSLERLEKYNDK